MDYSEKLKNLLEWNKIEYVLKEQEGNFKILQLFYDGLSIDETLPYEIEDLNDEELYDYIVNRCLVMNIPILSPDDYLDLKRKIVFNRYAGIICLILYAFMTAYQIASKNTTTMYIPFFMFAAGYSFYSFKELYQKSKILKSWDNGESIKKNIENYRKRVRRAEIESLLKRY